MTDFLEAGKELEQMFDKYQTKAALDFADELLADPALVSAHRAAILTIVAFGHYDKSGDGEKAREAAAAAIELFESDTNIYYEIPELTNALLRSYKNLCSLLCDLSISYEEFETYIDKLKALGPLDDIFLANETSVVEMKEQGDPWVDSMHLLAITFSGLSDSGRGSQAFGRAVCLFGLMLKERRRIRLSRTLLRECVYNYGVYSTNTVLLATQFCAKRHLPIMADNYSFILDRAANLIAEYRSEVDDDELLDKAVSMIDKKRQMLSNNAGLMRTGRMVIGIVFAALTVIFGYQWLFLQLGSWWRIALTILFALITLSQFAVGQQEVLSYMSERRTTSR